MPRQYFVVGGRYGKVGAVWQNVGCPAGMQGRISNSIPKKSSTVETELTVSQPLRRVLLLPFSTSNTLEVVHSKRVNVSQPPITTLCKRTACDADVLESNERREILFPLIHSVGRPYILVPYWSIAMRTGARFLYCPDFRTGKGEKPRVAETSRSRHVSK
jgi:hypothetical protein